MSALIAGREMIEVREMRYNLMDSVKLRLLSAMSWRMPLCEMMIESGNKGSS